MHARPLGQALLVVLDNLQDACLQHQARLRAGEIRSCLAKSAKYPSKINLMWPEDAMFPLGRSRVGCRDY